MAGFIRGGREALLSSWRAATVVSMVLDCSPMNVSAGFTLGKTVAHLSIRQLENQLDLIPLDVLGLHL